jgi:shikimate 5-dehydrogenase
MAPEYYYDRCECPTLKDAPDAPYFDIMRRPETLGSCCTMPLKLEVIEHVDVIDDDARAVGSVNTIFLESEQDGQARWVGTNNDWCARAQTSPAIAQPQRRVGCENPILSALTGISSPFPTDLPRSLAPGTAAGFLIGAGGAVRAAAYALHRLGCSPLYVVNRDPRETEALMAHNSNAFNIVALPLDVGAAQRILDANKLPIVAAIGAIPSSLPITQAEQAVYAIAALVFARPYAAPAPAIGPAHISAPARPIFLDMVYSGSSASLTTQLMARRAIHDPPAYARRDAGLAEHTGHRDLGRGGLQSDRAMVQDRSARRVR